MLFNLKNKLKATLIKTPEVSSSSNEHPILFFRQLISLSVKSVLPFFVSVFCKYFCFQGRKSFSPYKVKYILLIDIFIMTIRLHNMFKKFKFLMFFFRFLEFNSTGCVCRWVRSTLMVGLELKLFLKALKKLKNLRYFLNFQKDKTFQKALNVVKFFSRKTFQTLHLFAPVNILSFFKIYFKFMKLLFFIH